MFIKVNYKAIICNLEFDISNYTSLILSLNSQIISCFSQSYGVKNKNNHKIQINRRKNHKKYRHKHKKNLRINKHQNAQRQPNNGLQNKIHDKPNQGIARVLIKTFQKMQHIFIFVNFYSNCK